MSRIVAQSLFKTTEVKASWQSQTTSILIHAGLIALALLITVPVMEESRKAAEHVTLIAPQIPVYKPKIQAPPKVVLTHLAPRPSIIPPVIKVPPPAPVVAEKAQPVPPPAVKVVTPEPLVVAKLDTTPPPKIMEAAKAPPQPKVQIGGFGDPNAVKEAQTSRPAPVMMAKVGAFESPTGPGQSGAAGRIGSVKMTAFGSAEGSQGGTGRNSEAAVRTGGFGDGTATTGSANGHGAVKSSGFGEAVAVAPQARQALPAAAPSYTKVEILYKPRPTYSTEARNMRVEGQVALEVIFQASGAVKVVRVIRGLGHGLDEAAEQAALQVRFKPATRAGVPVDQSATISITFELT